MSVKTNQLIVNAFIEMGAYSPGSIPSPEEAAFGLAKLNRLLDAWAAWRAIIYTSQFLSFTLVPNLAVHTIGPAGSGATFTIQGSRPTKIEGANIILNNVSPPVNTPLRIRNRDWWLAQSVQTLASTLPTDLYYEPDFPLGSLFYWPIPQTDYGTQLECWTQLQQGVQLFENLILPPGYEDAITYALAVSLLPAGEKGVNPALVDLAKRALALIQGNNTPSLPMATVNSGMPRSGQRGSRQDWNYLSGRVV